MEENRNMLYVSTFNSTFILAIWQMTHVFILIWKIVYPVLSIISCLPKPPRATLGSFKGENMEHHRQILSLAI